MTPTPLPLRAWPSVAACVLGSAIGSLMLGTCALGLDALGGHTGAPGSLHGNAAGLIGAVALWLFAGGCIYAANRQWIGRARDEQWERFAICLVLAIPLFIVILLVGMPLYFSLGGQP